MSEDSRAPSSRRSVVRPGDVTPAEFYALLNSCVVPRPIAWVSTVGEDGGTNLAPYSLFTVVSSAPPIVMFVSLQREKDSVRNARTQGEFTINVASRAQMPQINATSETVAAGVDEAALAGVAMESGTLVGVPRVANSVVSLECRTADILVMGNSYLVCGEVVGVVTHDGVIAENGVVPPAAIDVLGKLGGPLWAGISDPVALPRPDML